MRIESGNLEGNSHYTVTKTYEESTFYVRSDSEDPPLMVVSFQVAMITLIGSLLIHKKLSKLFTFWLTSIQRENNRGQGQAYVRLGRPVQSRVDPRRQFVIADPKHSSTISTLCATHQRATKARGIVASESQRIVHDASRARSSSPDRIAWIGVSFSSPVSRVSPRRVPKVASPSRSTFCIAPTRSPVML